ncbi:uroporphyrinogen-III C-methyltransferase [Thalassotalea aquiviva]|uniref:uroporphyrinogen-III C-methyltransferase n=1 Tax=Thalassotalea aquiviva TaxID=3242415 RepID=UPI00352B8537
MSSKDPKKSDQPHANPAKSESASDDAASKSSEQTQGKEPQDTSATVNQPSAKLSAAEATKIAAQARAHNDHKQGAKGEDATAAKKTAQDNNTASPVSRKSEQIVNNKPPISKTAIIAFIIALIALILIIAYYFWHQPQIAQQQRAQQDQLAVWNQQQSQQIGNLEQDVGRQLNALKTSYQRQLQQIEQDWQQKNQRQIGQMESLLKQMAARQPDNWHLIETEYLVRNASRLLWLEKDIKTAIAMLVEARSRINDSNDARLFKIKALLQEDIEQLRLLPSIDTEAMILSFMTLAKQINSLPLKSIEIEQDAPLESAQELSHDVADWRQNLARSWDKFIRNFFIPRRQNGSALALMAPKNEAYLFQNLALKVQQIQWAISQESETLYQQSVADLTLWINQYFDLEASQTQQLLARLQELKESPITQDIPLTLRSHAELQKLLRSLSDGQYSPPPKPKTEAKTEAEKPAPTKSAPNNEKTKVDTGNEAEGII